MAINIYLGLGSNLGDRMHNLKQAISHFPPEIICVRKSSIYETEPWEYLEQPPFLNLVVEVQTDLLPRALLERLKSIELACGRQETFRFGPRLIDLDILFYGQEIIEEHGVSIPHPRMHERAFVLVPLAEIAPHFIHPVLRKSVQELLFTVNADGIRRLENFSKIPDLTQGDTDGC